MKTSSICSQCLRTLRQSASGTGSESYRLASRSLLRPRFLSTTNPACQGVSQAPEPSTTAASSTTQPPPTTVRDPTSSSESRGGQKPIPHVSTAEMQKQISSSLSRGGGGPTLTQSLAQKLRQTAKSTTESYITYGLTEAFFKSCAAQAPYTIPEDQRTKILTESGPPKTAEGEDLGIAEADSWWFTELGLQPTFSTWSQVTYLHMYLLTVKLRVLESRSAYTNYQRYLIEHFSNVAEDKMLLVHSINARGIRNKYLKDLFLQWRGVLAAYDEGLAKGDAVLAAAVWRNLWKGREDVDWDKVALVVVYMRRVLSGLADVPLDALVHNLDSGDKVWMSARHNLRQTADVPNQSSAQV